MQVSRLTCLQKKTKLCLVSLKELGDSVTKKQAMGRTICFEKFTLGFSYLSRAQTHESIEI